ncbi:MAG: M24 family metallopeptidase [Thermodesulfobacteriota bacterium]|nr:M24 family metallopeptidase [Thermodesulfobacteriota bacterium]
METMQPNLKSGRNTWDRINMPVEEFLARVKKIRQRMGERGIDVLLLYGNAYNEYGNYCYLSNYVIRLPQGAMVVVPKTGELSVIFEGALRGVPSVKKTTWIDDIRATGDVSKECVKYLQEKNLIPSVIGVAGLKQLMPHHQYQFLLDSLPKCKIVNAAPFIHELRMIKSPMEILQIRRASRVVVHTFDFITSTSFMDLREEALEAAARREARLEGAEDFRMMIAKPFEERWAFKPPEEKPLRSEDKVIIYLAVVFERYWAEAVRTFHLRDSSFVEIRPEEVKTLYETITEGMNAGKKVSQFYRETMAKIKKAKFDILPDYGLGQGIGLSPKELPMIAKEDRNILDQGMCLSLRLGVCDKEIGSVMVGHTIYLSRRGAEVLT